MKKENAREVLVTIFVLSGAAALIYQVAWQRVLLNIYGVQSEAATVVVTAFMLGLGLGALAGGWIADRPDIDPIRAFVAIEAGIAAYGAGSIKIIDSAGAITGPAGTGTVFLATFAVVALPTGAMGATLPILAARAARETRNVGAATSRLYAANTMGAAGAAFASGVVLLGWLGLQGTVWTAAGLNATAALAAAGLRRRTGDT